MSSNFPWPWVCLMVGVGISIFGIYVRKKLKASESWLKTDGLVLQSSTESGWSGVGGDRFYVVRPKVIYQYYAYGKAYTSSRLALIEANTANASLAEMKAEKYKTGQKVVVYYDPKNPSNATLKVGDPTNGKFSGITMFLGLTSMVVGIIWLLVARR